MQGKTVVIFGAGGFIGATLASHLESKGCRVVALSRSVCDMLDPIAVKNALDGISANYSVVHTACLSRHEEDDFGALKKNVAMVENFIRAHRPDRVESVVYLSSTDVYGNAPQIPVTEQTLVSPEGYYGISKYSNECLLLRSGQIGCPVTALRLPGIYGANDRGRSIMGMFARRVLKEEEVTIFGDGSTKRDFVLVDDLCRIIERILIAPTTGVFNVANGASLELKDILDTLSAVSGKKLNLVMAEAGSRSNDLVFDTSELQNMLGHIEMTPFSEGARILIDHLTGKSK